MCGIIGGTNPNWSYSKAVEVLKHRGPDAQKITPLEDFTLAFVRLSIIDTSDNANQPMFSVDNKVCIVFNGEIYGFKRLRAQLESLGHTFRTQSDTEVLLNAYLEWNDDLVDHIDGMFAFAIYDSRIKKIKIFRDRPGIKPLFYYHKDEEFAFASELKGITHLCSNINFEHDMTAVYDYLTYQYIPEPKTLYKNVYKLPPAHKLTYDLCTHKITGIKPYWKLSVDPSPKPIPIEKACDGLRELIKESIQDQMISDVPLGFFLSGGIDSSVVVAEASKLSSQVETFSIGFETEGFSETPFAKMIADLCNTKHHEKILTNTHTHQLLEKMKTWYDEPFADTSAMPSFLVAEFARQNVTVALTGDGGDELFGGYRRYMKFLKAKQRYPFSNKLLTDTFGTLKRYVRKHRLPYLGFKLLELMMSSDIPSFIIILGGLTDTEKELYRREWDISKDYDDYWYFKKFYKKDLPLFTRLQYVDFHTYLPNDILTKVDRVTMAVSLEARVPLLSKKIIEFAFSLPEKIRYYNGNLKGLVKHVYKDILPHDILSRGKKGFGIPKQYLNVRGDKKQETLLRDVFQII